MLHSLNTSQKRPIFIRDNINVEIQVISAKFGVIRVEIDTLQKKFFFLKKKIFF